MLYKEIKRLVDYGVRTGLTPETERIYTTNLLLELFHEDNYAESAEPTEPAESGEPADILAALLDEAVSRGLIQDSVVYRDLFDTKLMNTLLPRPAAVIATFNEKYRQSPECATAYYYQFSQDSNYIRRDRVARDMKWQVDSPYGPLDITINLSKPEKDPKAIAAARKTLSGSYPKCQLCMENEGYAGRVDHPARENHRVIPLTINDSPWGFQYSPYVYYNEHCIVFNREHIPMKIERATFVKLFDFVKLFPHYFLGSNADLPIVGGSILSHDHFQGGHYTFAMAKAPIIRPVTIAGYADITAGIVDWPLSVLRLRGPEPERLIDLAEHVLAGWIDYSDEAAFVYAYTAGERHNTITPIARFVAGAFELDLVLRNNITTPEHPLGVFHPHAQYHNIKKENIGLIEVMGLAVLPARLKAEMELLATALTNGQGAAEIRADERISKHADWAAEFLPKYPQITPENVRDILKQEIGITFTHVLEDAGVFKATPEGRAHFCKFLQQL